MEPQISKVEILVNKLARYGWFITQHAGWDITGFLKRWLDASKQSSEEVDKIEEVFAMYNKGQKYMLTIGYKQKRVKEDFFDNLEDNDEPSDGQEQIQDVAWLDPKLTPPVEDAINTMVQLAEMLREKKRVCKHIEKFIEWLRIVAERSSGVPQDHESAFAELASRFTNRKNDGPIDQKAVRISVALVFETLCEMEYERVEEFCLAAFEKSVPEIRAKLQVDKMLNRSSC